MSSAIKQVLMQEAQNLDVKVELDSIFESVNLSEEVKSQFSAAFEEAVKNTALELAESHIEVIAEQADILVEEKAQEKFEELSEMVNKYFEHITESWMTENKLAIENGLKVSLFDTFMGTLKEAFEEHNIELDEEKVDLVAELEEEIVEAHKELNSMLVKNAELNESVNAFKREKAITEAVADLSDVQRDRIMALAEGIQFDDHFSAKLSAIVEMVTPQSAPVQTALNENIDPVSVVVEHEEPIEEVPAQKPAASSVNQYLNY